MGFINAETMNDISEGNSETAITLNGYFNGFKCIGSVGNTFGGPLVTVHVFLYTGHVFTVSQYSQYCLTRYAVLTMTGLDCLGVSNTWTGNQSTHWTELL